MKQISVLRKILQMRGYLVIWQADYRQPFFVGKVVSHVGECFNLGNMIITKQTTKSDFFAQQTLSKRIEPIHWKGLTPTAQIKMARKINPRFWRVTRTRKPLTE